MRHLPALLLLAACGGGDSHGTTGEPGQPTEVLLAGWTPLVEVTVDDREPEWMLVDTGAPYTYLDPAVFSLDAATNVLRDRTLGAFGLTFDNRDLHVLDLGGNLAGLFGADVLSSYRFLLDYQNADARLLETDLPVDVGADTMPAEVVDAPIVGVGRRIIVDAEIEGVEARVMIDTGASYVTVDPSFLASLAATDRPELCCQTVITADGSFDVPLTRLKSVQLGGAAEVDSVAASLEYEGSTLLDRLSEEVGGPPLVALIGGSYLREFLVAVDYPDERLWLERYRSDHHIDRGEYIGPGFEIAYDQEEHFVVALVYQDSDAEAQGVTTQTYQLEAINGEMVGGTPIADVRAQIRAFAPGTVQEFGFFLPATATSVTRNLVVEDLLPAYR